MQVGILGPLTVHHADGSLVSLSGARLRSLLAWLAVNVGRPVSVPVLVDVVWGDEPPADAAKALQTLVSGLRRGLGDPALIVGSAAGYELKLPRDAIDANRFEDLAGAGAVAMQSGRTTEARPLLREALALWRGPALSTSTRWQPRTSPASPTCG